MRRGHREIVPVRAGEVERIVDPAPADVGRAEAFGRIITASRLDIVHHQVEGRCGAELWRLFRLSDDHMRAAAKFQNGKVVIGEYRAQADGLEPPLGGGDIGRRKPDMTNRHRRRRAPLLRPDA